MTDKRAIHYVLHSEDGDLIARENLLPKRRFNRTVCEILVNESKGALAAVFAPIFVRIIRLVTKATAMTFWHSLLVSLDPSESPNF